MFSRRGTLAVVCLATAMLMLDIAVVNTALPKIASSLDAGISGLQWVVDAYTVALAAVVLTSGSIADRFGRRRLFAIGLVVFTGASLWCGAAGSIAMLDAARAVQGLGAAILFATSLALLADAFPDWKERSKALAIYGATIGAAFAVGPAIGGAMTSYLGWRWMFYVNVPVGIATIAATYRWVRESRDPNARRVDWPGQIALVGGLFLLVLALLRGNDVGWSSAQIVAELTGAVVLIVGLPRDRDPGQGADAPARPLPEQGVRGRADRRVLDLGAGSPRSSCTRRCTSSRSSVSRRSRRGWSTCRRRC